MRCKRELEDVQPGRRHRHGCRRVTHSRIHASSYEGVIGSTALAGCRAPPPSLPTWQSACPAETRQETCYYVVVVCATMSYVHTHGLTSPQPSRPDAQEHADQDQGLRPHAIPWITWTLSARSLFTAQPPLPPCRLVLVTLSLDTWSSRHRDKPPAPRKRCQPCSVAPNSLSTCSAEQHRMAENTSSSVVGSWPRPSLSQIASDQFQTGQAVGCPAPCAAPPCLHAGRLPWPS